MRTALLGLALASLVLGGVVHAEDRAISFKKDVAPILVKTCLGCHNDTKASVGLNMATFAKLRQGGKESGSEIIIPGKPESSRLIEVVKADAEPRMPLKAKPLDETAIKILSDWVAQGAKFDGASEDQTTLASLVDPLVGLPKIAVKPGVSDPVTSIAFSPDSKLLAATLGKSALLFDAETGKEIANLSDHPGPLTYVKFTPDNKTVVVAGGRPGQFGSIATWDLRSKTRILEARGQTDTILSADLAPDGKSLAGASYDRSIFVWDLVNGTILHGLKEHTDAVHSVAFSLDGKHLASAAADRTVKYWDLATEKRLTTLSDATAELYAIQFGLDNKTVIAAGVDRIIRAWDPTEKGGRLVQSAFAHDGAIVKLAISSDRKVLASSGEDKKIKLWKTESLEPIGVLDQPDWAHALDFDPTGKKLAIGRYDGSIAVVDLADRTKIQPIRVTNAMIPAPKAPALIRNATLDPINPRGGTRGGKIRVNLTGQGVGETVGLIFPEKGISGAIVPLEKPDPNRLQVDLTIAADARAGVHTIMVQTPLGIPAGRPFHVSAYPESTEIKPVSIPGTIVGTLKSPGEVANYPLDLVANQTIVAESVSKAVGSTLDTRLQFIDKTGRIVADTLGRTSTSADPILSFTAQESGSYTLKISDLESGGSGNHLYRINIGELSYIRSSYPLGVQRNMLTKVSLEGENLGELTSVDLNSNAEPGTMAGLPIVQVVAGPAPVVVVAEGPQLAESANADSPEKASLIPTPGGFSGVLDKPGSADYVKFEAKKGEPVIVGVFGRRLGLPIDATIEILDAQGQTVPQVILQRVAETAVAFRDHDASSQGIRLTQWTELAMNDYILMGREVMKIFTLPRNPDDDCVFYRRDGRRAGFFGTTPEHHPMSQPVYKVLVHPPGTKLTGEGIEPITLPYFNDDSIGKDPQLTFIPPQDGTYFVRIEESRGLGGPEFGYHLILRKPTPAVSVSVPENLNVPRGGTAIITVTASRSDGFDGPVEVEIKDLPAGVHASQVTIEAGQTSAELLIIADADAAAFSAPTWKSEARAVIAGQPFVQTIDPGGAERGFVTVTPVPNLKIKAVPDSVTIVPGQDVELKFMVERGAPFAGRVPIDVRNLPYGVRVLNIGLNGVLVTEQQTERSVTIYAEPWVKPMTRPFFAVGKAESAGTEQSSPPILLKVAPSPTSTVSAP